MWKKIIEKIKKGIFSSYNFLVKYSKLLLFQFLSMFPAFSFEIKNSVFSSSWSFIKYFGILLLPLLYSFMYIFAFFNPFANSGNLDVAIVISKKDGFSNSFVNEVNKNKNKIKIGDLNMTFHLNKIYSTSDKISDPSQRKNESKKHYTTIFIKPLTEAIGWTMFHTYNNIKNETLSKKINDLIKEFQKLKIIKIYSNYQKNYLIAFGSDLFSSMQPVYERLIESFFLMNMQPVWNWMSSQPISLYPDKTKIISDYKSFWFDMQREDKNQKDKEINILLKNIQNVNINSQMGEYAEYGYGLAPFFITLAMWIGSMGLTIIINGRLYKSKHSKIKSYLAKLFSIWISISIGAIILCIALAFIGFTRLNGGYWRILLQTIISGILLSTIVFSIRASIPNKPFGIIIVIMLLVIQMSVSGGLFSTKLQFALFRYMHYIFPYTYSVDAFREMAYDPNWLKWFLDIIIMLGFSTIIFIGSYFIWTKRKRLSEKLNRNNIKQITKKKNKNKTNKKKVKKNV